MSVFQYFAYISLILSCITFLGLFLISFLDGLNSSAIVIISLVSAGFSFPLFAASKSVSLNCCRFIFVGCGSVAGPFFKLVFWTGIVVGGFLVADACLEVAGPDDDEAPPDDAGVFFSFGFVFGPGVGGGGFGPECPDDDDDDDGWGPGADAGPAIASN